MGKSVTLESRSSFIFLVFWEKNFFGAKKTLKISVLNLRRVLITFMLRARRGGIMQHKKGVTAPSVKW